MAVVFECIDPSNNEGITRLCHLWVVICDSARRSLSSADELLLWGCQACPGRKSAPSSRIPRRRGGGQGNGMAEQTVAVFFGGRSVEHEVSVITGHQIMDALKAAGYRVLPLYMKRMANGMPATVCTTSSYLPIPRVNRPVPRVSPVSV